MYAQVFSKVLLPALDVANRTQVARVLASLEKSQWYTADDIRALQRTKLDAMLAWTRHASPFYVDHWKNAPASRRAASQFPALDGLPIVGKHDLRAHRGAFPLPGVRGRVFTVKTSGSTGEPMTYYRSALQDSWFWALRFRMWQWAGYRPGEPYVTLNLNPRTAWHKRLQDVFFRCYYHGFNANAHDVDAAIRDLARKSVKNLVGYASSLYLLSTALEARGRPDLGISTILSTGDTLFPFYRARIEETFGARINDYYGAGGEGIHLASQCEERDLYHLHGENAIIEVLRNGEPVRPGELGEIVITQLDNHAMPLIRYATQDVALAAEQGARCGCGREMPVIRGVQGRVPDIVFAPDGSALVVHFFTILFEYLDGIRQFQIVQHVPERIEALIVRASDYDESATESRVRKAVVEATHGSLDVDFRYVDTIPLERSGKRRFVVSRIRSQSLAVDIHDDEAVAAVGGRAEAGGSLPRTGETGE